MEISELREVLSYDPVTGKITWLQDRIGANGSVRAKAGDEAGSLHTSGYRYISINGERMLAHRVAWALHYGCWPEGDIDHRNEIKSENWIDNLRGATRSNNMSNRGPTKRNKLGAKGVELTRTGRYAVKIWKNYKRFHVGTFDTIAEASQAYDAEAKRLHGEFASPSTLRRVAVSNQSEPRKAADVVARAGDAHQTTTEPC